MTTRVFDVSIWTGSRTQFLAEAAAALATAGAFKVLHTLNPEILMTARDNPAYKAVLNAGDWNTVDGVGLQVALERKGAKVPERLCGSDLIYPLVDLCLQEGRAVYIIGGAPDRLAAGVANLKAKYPGLRIEGISPAPGQGIVFREQPQIEQDLRRLRPGLVAVCLGAPRQEQWIQANRELLTACGVGLAGGLGGTIDFVSGIVPRAPSWVRKLGMEWLYRLVQSPSRIKRQLKALPLFAFYALTGRHIATG